MIVTKSCATQHLRRWLKHGPTPSTAAVFRRLTATTYGSRCATTSTSTTVAANGKFTWSLIHDQVKLALCEAVPTEHFVPLSAVAKRLMDVDEDMFETLSSTIAGGLLGVLERESAEFETKRDVEQRLLVRRKSRLAGESTDAGVQPPPSDGHRSKKGEMVPVLAEKEAPAERSAVALFWDKYDPKDGILRYIPTRFVSWSAVASVLPADELKMLPKEYRSRNVVRVLRPYCDVALLDAGEVFLRIKPHLIGEPWYDPDAAEVRLSVWLPNPAFVLAIARELPLSGVALNRVASGIDFPAVRVYLEEITADSGRLSPSTLFGMHPTLFCVYNRRVDTEERFDGNHARRKAVFVASYIGFEETSAGGDGGSGGADNDETAKRELRRIAQVIVDHMFPQRKVRATDIAAFLEERGEMEALDCVGGLARLLTTQKHVLVMNFDGTIRPAALAMDDGRETAAETANTKSMLSSSGSYCGRLAEPPIADDDALNKFVDIASKRWANRLKEEQQRKKRDLLYPQSAFRSPDVLRRYIHALCPTERWISLSELVALLSEEARLWMPTTSLLGFLDKKPELFDLVEKSHGSATEYGVRGRLPHEEVYKIEASTWTDDELLRFILAAIGIHGSTLTNLWAKLPLSVRKQFGKKSTRALRAFMVARPETFSFPSQNVVKVVAHPLDVGDQCHEKGSSSESLGGDSTTPQGEEVVQCESDVSAESQLREAS